MMIDHEGKKGETNIGIKEPAEINSLPVHLQ